MLQSYNAEINGTQLKWLDAPPQMQARQRVVVTLADTQVSRRQPSTKSKYDFSDLIGRLKWRGDAVAEQRSLRNEW